MKKLLFQPLCLLRWQQTATVDNAPAPKARSWAKLHQYGVPVGVLAIEQRNLRSLQHVAAVVALCGLQQEEHFDVAKDRESEVRRGVCVKVAELRHRGAERVLRKLQVQVRRGGARGVEAELVVRATEEH